MTSALTMIFSCKAPGAVCTAVSCMSVLISLAFVQLSSAASLARVAPHPAPGEILYHTGESLSFKCQDSPKHDKIFVNWYINGMPVNKKTQKHMRSWRVQKTTVQPKRYLHGNELTLIATPKKETTGTLLCTVKGRYSTNIVKVYNLVRDIERKPAGPLLGREDDTQSCPLYPDHLLTLTCENAIKYVHVTNWIWQRDSKNISDAHESQLTVTEPGMYKCWYQIHHGGQMELLTFKVTPATKKSAKVKAIKRDWEFCKYSTST